MIRVRARRAARVTAGIAGVLGAGLTALLALLSSGSPHWAGPHLTGAATFTLLGTWGAMVLVYGFAYLGERSEARRRRDESFTGYLTIHQNERGAIFWPMAAVSLLAPLTIHFLIYALAGMDTWGFPGAFDRWIGGGGGLTMPAHAALVYCCWTFARDRTGAATSSPQRLAPGWRALWITVAAGMLPGALFLLVPPLLVLVTGLLFIPWMFAAMDDLHFREQEALAELERAMADTGAEEAFLRAKEVLLEGRESAERIGALRFLTQHYDRARVKGVLDLAVRSGDPNVGLAAVRTCLELRHRPSPEDLDALVWSHPDAAADVARLLGHYRDDDQALRTLVSLLRNGSADGRREAIRSLGRIGSLDLIPTLRQTAARYLTERKIEALVDAAVKRIQDRHAKGPAGALALAGDSHAEGDLSIVDDRRGALSPTER